MTLPYDNNWEHLAAMQEWLDVLLRRECLRSRRALASQHEPQIFKGAYISDDEVNQLLDTFAPEQSEASEADAGASADALLEEAEAMRALIAERVEASQEEGIVLLLPRLARLFGLTPFEERVAFICLAPEMDLKYERLYGYLQDDMTRKQPSVELALRLLCLTPVERLYARRNFTPQSRLFRAHLLLPLDDGNTSQLARPLKLDERIIGFLLDTRWMDALSGECASIVTAPKGSLKKLLLPDSLKKQLHAAATTHLQNSSTASLSHSLAPALNDLPASSSARRKLICHFHGAEGAGKKSLAAALCGELGIRLMAVDLRQVLSRAPNFNESIRAFLRESLLQPAAIYLENFERLLERDEQAALRLEAIARAVDDFSWLTFISTPQPWEPGGLFQQHLFTSVELPSPPAAMRQELWDELASAGVNVSTDFAPDIDWSELAAKFRLTGGQMQRAISHAQNAAQLRDGSNAVINSADLHRGCRAQSNQNLNALAPKLKLEHDWPDITLPPDALAQLRELCAQVSQRRTVHEDWGFEQKLSLGKGLCALFYGASGTGKTMAVEIIARELRLEAFKIDLSTVVSKYIGETEKNLSRIFEEAETSNAILFFDEADALFGKRSEVKDAHDRYANIEINYLLQRMEQFSGIAILATNLRKHIDEAFFRRMNFAIEFPFPDEQDRYRIWKQHFPPAAPLAKDIDFDFLASRLNITGGSIRNIVVNAAFLAAANSGVINMQHLVRATRREYEKMGRLCTEMEFAPYQAMLN